jgi:hypothetical protein
MVERRQHFGFALKAREPFGITGDRRWQHLQRDLAFRLVSVARYTAPMPPSPSFAMTS